jgi:hypothetical protein
MTLWGILSGFVGGLIAWVVTTTLAQPFQRFLQLRQEAAIAIAQFEDRPWIGNPEAKPPTNEWLDERLAVYDKAGTALVAFAISNSFVTRALYHPFLGGYRCYVQAAGDSLRNLGASHPGTPASRHFLEALISELKIGSVIAVRRNRFGKIVLILGGLTWAVVGTGALIVLANNQYSRDAKAVLTALAFVPVAAIVSLVMLIIAPVPIALVLGAPGSSIAHLLKAFRIRWKGFLGLALLMAAIIAVLTKSSPFWR